jgi:hypothetical protein
MALTISKKSLPGFIYGAQGLKDTYRFITSSEYRNRAIQSANNAWEEYVDDVKNLRYTVPEAVESYKEDLRAMGINNAGDFAKWTLKCIAGVGIVVISSKILGVVFTATGVVGAVGKFAFQTAAIMSAVTYAPLVSTFIQSVTQATGQIINFNINQTDEELYNQIDEKIKGMHGLVGTTLGSALGWLVCGALPNSLTFRYNKSLAVAIAQDLGEESRQELYSYVAQLIRLTTQTLINVEMVNRFTSLRRELKRNPDSDFAKFVRRTVGEDVFKKWGEKNQQPWTIKKNIIDAQVEKEKDPLWKQFYENTLEGFSDSCMEASMVVATNLDSYIASQKIARTNLLGKIQTVRIKIGDSLVPKIG